LSSLELMETGTAFFATHEALDPASLARLVEERGHSALFFADHTHLPVSFQSTLPEGGAVPRKYAHVYDLFVAITAAVVATSRLRVGSGICLVVERDPIVTAKQVASVDHLSGGRFEFGIGAGWNREEMRNHGTDPRTRFSLMRDRVEAMKAIWTQDEAEYHGRFVDFDPIWAWPKPLQKPHPPVLVGGDGPKVLDRVVAYGDAWFPDYAPEGILERIPDLRSRAQETGRHIAVHLMGVPADPAVLERCEKAGVARASHWLPSAAGGPVERALEQFEESVAEWHGE
jgi:probable F420-dependent oxidoreductase